MALLALRASIRENGMGECRVSSLSCWRGGTKELAARLRQAQPDKIGVWPFGKLRTGKQSTGGLRRAQSSRASGTRPAARQDYACAIDDPEGMPAISLYEDSLLVNYLIGVSLPLSERAHSTLEGSQRRHGCEPSGFGNVLGAS